MELLQEQKEQKAKECFLYENLGHDQTASFSCSLLIRNQMYLIV